MLFIRNIRNLKSVEEFKIVDIKLKGSKLAFNVKFLMKNVADTFFSCEYFLLLALTGDLRTPSYNQLLL